MTFQEIRLAAKMLSIVADMEEIKANIEAMKVENEIRKSDGDELAYSETAFRTQANSLSHLSWRLMNEI